MGPKLDIPDKTHLTTWGKLFEINDVVSYRFVKCLNINITNLQLFLLIKCNAKDSLIFPTKNNGVFAYVVNELIS